MADAQPLPPVMEPMGDSGLRAYGGVIEEEFLKELRGSKGRQVYREMANNDPTIGAILEGFSALICGVEWTVTAANDTPAAEDAKKFVEEVIDDMETPLTDVIAEACTMFTFGFAPCEITYKRRAGPNVAEKRLRSNHDDGKWGLQAIELRAQTSLFRWEYDTAKGELLGMWQMPTWKRPAVMIPMERLALFRTTSVKNNPEGLSILRRLYRPWRFKSVIEEIEAIGVERDLAGLPVARIPIKYMDPNASPAEKAIAEAYKRMVSQLRRENREGVILPSDMYENQGGATTGIRKFELSLLTSGGSRSFDTSAIVDRYDRKMATAVLMDFIFLGQQSVGSFALSSDKTALFAQALGAYLKRIAQVLNSVIDRLWELNAMDPKIKPTLTPGDLEKPDLTQLGGFLSALVGAGMQLFPHRETENFLRGVAGIPLAPEEGLGDQGAPGAMPEDDDEWRLPAKVEKSHDTMALLAEMAERAERLAA